MTRAELEELADLVADRLVLRLGDRLQTARDRRRIKADGRASDEAVLEAMGLRKTRRSA